MNFWYQGELTFIFPLLFCTRKKTYFKVISLVLSNWIPYVFKISHNAFPPKYDNKIVNLALSSLSQIKRISVKYFVRIYQAKRRKRWFGSHSCRHVFHSTGLSVAYLCWRLGRYTDAQRKSFIMDSRCWSNDPRYSLERNIENQMEAGDVTNTHSTCLLVSCLWNYRNNGT